MQDSYKIAALSGQIFNKIKLGFTGGATDMFIPVNDWDNNEKVYCYDINSLYPYVMMTKPMPVGKPTYFKYDIRKINPDAFGFFYCKVTTPQYLEHPIIKIHNKTKNGIRTIAPLGSF